MYTYMAQAVASAQVLQGVVLGVRRGFRGPGPAALGPEARFAGLSLLLRGVLTQQRHGVARILVVVGPRDAELAHAVAADRRVLAQVTVVVQEDGVELLALLRREIRGAFLLGRYEIVSHDAVIAGLLERAAQHSAVVVRKNGEASAPLVARSELLERLTGDDVAALSNERGVCSWDIGPRWHADVGVNAERRVALRQLFEACRKPVDGLVSRHLNRHVSLMVSRLLVDTPITPNMMTVVTFLVAVAAAAFAVQGGYLPTLIAAALMQLNSILDGCDGELARVRFQGSRLGQWLDTVGDDASNVVFWGALAVGARSVPVVGPWLELAGWVAAGANAAAALINYGLLARRASGDLYALEAEDSAPPGPVTRFLRVVLKQDFFLLLLLGVALAGLLHFVLPLVALGAVITLVNAASRARRVTAVQGAKSQ
jgi:phosphatidylglycerophosphate synthase